MNRVTDKFECEQYQLYFLKIVMPDLTIKPGRIARTLAYEDSFGTITFTFDWDSSRNPATVIFDRPSKTIIHNEQARLDLALERIKNDFITRGFSFKFSDEPESELH